jgi:hypothetical protein
MTRCLKYRGKKRRTPIAQGPPHRRVNFCSISSDLKKIPSAVCCRRCCATDCSIFSCRILHHAVVVCAAVSLASVLTVPRRIFQGCVNYVTAQVMLDRCNVSAHVYRILPAAVAMDRKFQAILLRNFAKDEQRLSYPQFALPSPPCSGSSRAEVLDWDGVLAGCAGAIQCHDLLTLRMRRRGAFRGGYGGTSASS